jgi:L-arabinokinase
VPAVVLANFTWDWIYEGFPDFERRAPGVLDIVRRAYRHATRALRLPLHGGFVPMSRVTTDIPLIARRSTRPRAETRARLGLSNAELVILPSFGGHGFALPYGQAADIGAFTVVVTDDDAPSSGIETMGRLRRVGRSTLDTLRLRYEDLVAAADVVVTKPGYGIVSECIANGVALVYTPRGSFVEEDVLVAEMPRFLRCERIEVADLRAGRWRSAIEAALAKGPPPETIRIDGAEEAARAILDLAQQPRG